MQCELSQRLVEEPALAAEELWNLDYDPNYSFLWDVLSGCFDKILSTYHYQHKVCNKDGAHLFRYTNFVSNILTTKPDFLCNWALPQLLALYDSV
jgi:hypothetical protein